MIKTTNTLTCNFKDSSGKSRGMNIDNPIEALTPEKIEAFMNYLIEKDVIMLDVDNSDLHYAVIGGASLTSKAVEDIPLT